MKRKVFRLDLKMGKEEESRRDRKMTVPEFRSVAVKSTATNSGTEGTSDTRSNGQPCTLAPAIFILLIDNNTELNVTLNVIKEERDTRIALLAAMWLVTHAHTLTHSLIHTVNTECHKCSVITS